MVFAAVPWVRKRLRGQEVLARCDEHGALISDGGRVEIRYRPDGTRAYRAGVRNLEPARDATILPDEHCARAEVAPEREASDTAARAKPAKSTARAHAPGAASASKTTAALIAYADGACTGNPGPAGLGALIIDGALRHELSEYLGHGTNNIAELTAILRVAERLEKELRSIEIRTDSQYSIGVLTKGWKVKANQALVAESKVALSRLEQVRLTYVAGHSGEPGNDRVDELARAAIVRRGTEAWTAG